MATAFDLGNPRDAKCFDGCVHIYNKQAVGHRLAVAARNQVYNEQSTTWSGPRVERVESRRGAETVLITYGGPGTDDSRLKLRGDYGFEVCAESCSVRIAFGNLYNPILKTGWSPATIVRSSRKTVRIKFDRDLFNVHPTQIRYAYDDMPNVFYGTGPAVFNHAGLPATPGVYNISIVLLERSRAMTVGISAAIAAILLFAAVRRAVGKGAGRGGYTVA